MELNSEIQRLHIIQMKMKSSSGLFGVNEVRKVCNTCPRQWISEAQGTGPILVTSDCIPIKTRRQLNKGIETRTSIRKVRIFFSLLFLYKIYS